MVKIVTVGILAIQGDISEHVNSLENAFKELNFNGKTISIKHKKQIDEIDALILPGGESTTISKFLNKTGIQDTIIQSIKEQNLAVMGTCAGCVLLAKEITNNDHLIEPLQTMDIEVERNAFGRQKESFEKEIDFKEFSNPYHAVFIRAPVITKTWGNCEILAEIDKKIIAARQGNLLALSFHPELTSDMRIYRYFLEMI